jgi:ubiquinone/menaquinone biosynthesis C-methylase UbiE
MSVESGDVPSIAADSGGDACHCTACGENFAAFDYYGVPPRIGRCPRCGAKPRHRALLWYLENHGASVLGPGSRVLEIGPGKFATRFLPHAAIIGDASYLAVDLRRLHHPTRLCVPHGFVQASALCLPFADATFDLVLCNNTLPFIAEDVTAISEISRCLKDQGMAMLQSHRGAEPTSTAAEHARRHPEIGAHWYAENAHHWVYGPDYFARLERCGLHARMQTPQAARAPEFCLRYGLKAHEELIVAFKTSAGAHRFAAS